MEVETESGQEAARSSLVFATRRPALRYLLTLVGQLEGLDLFETDPGFLGREVARREASLVLIDTAEEEDVAGCVAAVRAATSAARIVTVGAADPGADDRLPWPATVDYLRSRIQAWLERRTLDWTMAPPPPDEAERLASLHGLGVLDTPPEDRYDAITREAAELFGVPIALVSLVDTDRQWFKSAVGLDAEETPRDRAFCAHAILGEDVLHVPDAHSDPRFADNPLVRGLPSVRFYAGAPLTLSDGRRVGTLCAIDRVPGEASKEALEALVRLAGRVVEELESSG